MSRSYAQKISPTHTGPSFESLSARASYWARLQRQQEQDAADQQRYDLSEMSQGAPRDLTQFAGANVETATLQSPPAPYGNSEPSIAGIGEGGIAPPPPPH